MKHCEYGEIQHYEEFVLRVLLNHVLIDLRESDALEDVFDENE